MYDRLPHRQHDSIGLWRQRDTTVLPLELRRNRAMPQISAEDYRQRADEWDHLAETGWRAQRRTKPPQAARPQRLSE